MYFYHIHKFLTSWVFVLVIFHNITSKFLSLPYLTFAVILNGLYFSYINPTKYYIEYYNENNELSEYILEGVNKNIMDIVLHISPFIFIISKYGIEPLFSNWKMIPSLLIILLYFLLYNPCHIYRLPLYEILILATTTIILYNILNLLINYKNFKF